MSGEANFIEKARGIVFVALVLAAFIALNMGLGWLIARIL